LNRNTSKPKGASRYLGTIIVSLALIIPACGPATTETSGLADLQLVGVDFELNSIIVTNVGTTDVRTEGLWAYRDGESFEFDIFTIEPRATILFSMRELGDISVAGGEIALADDESLSDPDALLEYVAWGDGLFALSDTATEAGLWPEDQTVGTGSGTALLLRVDPHGNGPTAWEASDEVG